MAACLLIIAKSEHALAQKKPQDRKDGPKVEQGTPQEYAALLQMKEVVGKLSNIAGTKSLTFDIEYLAGGKSGSGEAYTLNKAVVGQAQKQRQYEQQMANLMREQQQAMQIQNPQKRKQKMRQIAIQMQKMQTQQMYKGPDGQPGANGQKANANRAYKEFEVDLADTLVVRRNFVPWEYDDKGYLKTYTQDEITAMRGKDSSKPGYTAKFEDLQGGQIVKLYLTTPTTKPEARKDAKAEPKKTEDESAGSVTRPVVTMILILAEAPDQPVTTKKNMPKKKK